MKAYCVLTKVEAAIKTKESFKVTDLANYLIEPVGMEKEDAKRSND
jgi:hypothetical protein